MNKKLRLLVTTKCPNKCPMCCNNQFDFSKLPVVDRWDYDEIMITGGEPLLYSEYLRRLIISIKDICHFQSNKPKIFIYTACFVKIKLYDLIKLHIDGIVLTPHNKSDIYDFVQINDFMRGYAREDCKHLSLRLNLFPDMKALLPEDIDLSLWQVKDMEWVKDCPVPEGEDFRRIANLW